MDGFIKPSICFSSCILFSSLPFFALFFGVFGVFFPGLLHHLLSEAIGCERFTTIR